MAEGDIFAEIGVPTPVSMMRQTLDGLANRPDASPRALQGRHYWMKRILPLKIRLSYRTDGIALVAPMNCPISGITGRSDCLKNPLFWSERKTGLSPCQTCVAIVACLWQKAAATQSSSFVPIMRGPIA